MSSSQCGLCDKEYDENEHIPKLLSCEHTLCLLCAEQHTEEKVVKSQRESAGLSWFHVKCPFCPMFTELDEFSITGASKTASPASFLPTNLEVELPETCSLHNNPFIKYCKQHRKSVCDQCEDTHGSCELLELERHKEELRNKEVLLEKVIGDKHNLKRRQSAQSDVLKMSKDAALRKIDKEFDECFKSLTELLDKRRQCLRQEVEERFKSKDASLHREMSDLDEELSTLEKSGRVMNVALKRKESHRIAAFVNQDEHTNKKLIKAKESVKVVKNPDNFFHFELGEAVPDLQRVIQRIGIVSEIEAPALPKVYDFKADNVIAGLASSVSFFLSSSFYDVGSVTIHSSFDGDFDLNIDAFPNAKKVNANTMKIEVFFKPHMPVPHECTVYIMGSVPEGGIQEFDVHTNDPVQVIGDQNGPFQRPRCVIFDDKDNLNVIDQNGVFVFDQNGTTQLKLAHERGNNYWSGSMSLAIDVCRSRMYAPLVTDKGGILHSPNVARCTSVIVYGLIGKSKIAVLQHKNMKKALRVVSNREGKIIISDAEANCLFMFDNTLKFEKIIGKEGSNPGEFKCPTYLCIGPNDDIVVSDAKNHRIQVLDNRGNFKYQFGTYGSGVENLDMPAGVTVDDKDHILVSDHGNKRIQIFTYQGTFTSTIKVENSEWLCGIAISKDGHVYVVDRAKNCVTKYKYLSEHENKLVISLIYNNCEPLHGS